MGLGSGGGVWEVWDLSANLEISPIVNDIISQCFASFTRFASSPWNRISLRSFWKDYFTVRTLQHNMPRLSKSRRASRLAAQSRIRDRGSGQFLSNNANDPRPVDQENAEILDVDDSNIIYINDEEEDAMYQWSCKHSAVVTDTADDVGVDTVGIVDTLPSSANIDSEQQSTDTVDIQPREAMREEATLDVPDGAKFLFGADYLSNAPKRSAVVCYGLVPFQTLSASAPIKEIVEQVDGRRIGSRKSDHN